MFFAIRRVVTTGTVAFGGPTSSSLSGVVVKKPVFSFINNSANFTRSFADFTTFKPAVRAQQRLKEKAGDTGVPPLRDATAPKQREGPKSLVLGFGGQQPAAGGGEAAWNRAGGARPPPRGRGPSAGGRTPGKGKATGARSRDAAKKATLSESTALFTRVVHIGRVSRMTGQGRKTQFRALVIIGNGNGAAGFGVGKGLNPRSALLSAVREGEKDLVVIDIAPWGSLYHDVQGYCNNTKVIIRAIPSHKWYATAGKLMKAIMECAGISTYSCRILGRRNPFSIVNAAFDALGQHKTPKEIAQKRGRKLIDKANPDMFDTDAIR